MQVDVAAGVAAETKLRKRTVWQPGDALPPRSEYWTPQMAAQYGKVCTDTIYLAMTLGQLRYWRPPGSRLKNTKADWIDIWVEQYCLPEGWRVGDSALQ